MAGPSGVTPKDQSDLTKCRDTALSKTALRENRLRAIDGFSQSYKKEPEATRARFMQIINTLMAKPDRTSNDTAVLVYALNFAATNDRIGVLPKLIQMAIDPNVSPENRKIIWETLNNSFDHLKVEIKLFDIVKKFNQKRAEGNIPTNKEINEAVLAYRYLSKYAIVFTDSKEKETISNLAALQTMFAYCQSIGKNVPAAPGMKKRY